MSDAINEEEFICLKCGDARSSEANLKVHHSIVHEGVDWLACTVYVRPMQPGDTVCRICGCVRDDEAKLKIHYKIVHEEADYRALTVNTKTTPFAAREFQWEPTPRFKIDRSEAEILQQQLEAIEAEEAVQAAIRANFEEFARKRQ